MFSPDVPRLGVDFPRNRRFGGEKWDARWTKEDVWHREFRATKRRNSRPHHGLAEQEAIQVGAVAVPGRHPLGEERGERV